MEQLEQPKRGLILEGSRIRLEPVDALAHGDALYAASHGDGQEVLWTYLSIGPFKDKEEFKTHLKGLEEHPERIFFTVIDKPSQQPIGIILYLSVDPMMHRLEMGGWYTPRFHRTYANTETCYLMLRHAFEVLHYRRVEWRCDTLNEASKTAAGKLGFTFEGVLRQHMILKGEVRDTATFSMLESEWKDRVKANLELKLAK